MIKMHHSHCILLTSQQQVQDRDGSQGRNEHRSSRTVKSPWSFLRRNLSLQADTDSIHYGFEDTFKFQSSNSAKSISFFANPDLQNPLCAPWFDVEIISERAPIDLIIGPAEGYQRCVNHKMAYACIKLELGERACLCGFLCPGKVARRLRRGFSTVLARNHLMRLMKTFCGHYSMTLQY
ncbi:hypothetical protein PMIN01_08143 [Paraphaeosphaeria minitans]|uniref:Uncharacterized protein n=1 Tax=Paraphaeosphaeria minitans TaxID=565426 RepID=A0A9P6GEY7_9PLEO|nr:hypothetical protein PMIN01_08143 [Paraphaeosphaeria minitans]